MGARVAIHGLEASDGDTAFAFAVVRLVAATDRAGVIEVVRQLAPLLPDADEFIGGLPDPFDEPIRMLGIPWAPAEDNAVIDQRAAIEASAALGVEAVWCFQTSTCVAPSDDGAGAGANDDDDVRDDANDDDDADDEDVDADDEAAWSHGLPPQIARVRFPVDGYPAIVDELDWEDVGVAFKLAGAWMPGENLALIGFHTLWLAPYGERYRNAAVTIDERHHSAHLWVDRFAAPSSARAQVRHLLWVLTKIDQVTPIVHARFGGATMAQKYGRLMGEADDDAFVLGGNPLLAVYAHGGADGDARVEHWVTEQLTQRKVWASDELAQMLRELAIEIVTASGETADAEPDAEAAAADAAPDAVRGKQIASDAGELLVERARAGVLDAQAVARLRPVLAATDRYEHRRRAVVELVGAARDRAAVPALIAILDDNLIASVLDAIGKDELIAETATALGAIGDPAAVAALARVVAAAGTHNDKPRPAAGDALARCLAAASAPRAVADDVLAALLATIEHDRDVANGAGCQLAYGRIAAQLPDDARASARARLATAPVTRGGPIPLLARRAALAIAGADAPSDDERVTLAAALHDVLTGIGYDHDGTVRDLRIALQAAAALPALVAADDVVWLTRFAEADVRASAHALLAALGHARPVAPAFERVGAAALDDDALVRALAEPHVVGRAALIADAGRRHLGAARAAIAAAASDAIARARQGAQHLLAPDARVLAAAVEALRVDLDDDAIAIFDRLLRHSNPHVKWALLKDAPADPRLIGGMFHVLGERWGWQETTAKQWLAQFAGSDAYEAARRGGDAAAAEKSDDESAN